MLEIIEFAFSEPAAAPPARPRGDEWVPVGAEMTAALRAMVHQYMDHVMPDESVLDAVFEAAKKVIGDDEAPSPRRRTALLADDASGLLICLGVLLEANGFDVVCTTSEAEALAELGSPQVFDLVVTDETCLDSLRGDFIDKVRAARPDLETIFLSDLGGADAEIFDEPSNVIALRAAPQWRSRKMASNKVAAA